MTREEFDALVRRLEPVAQKSPHLYALQLVGLIALAYGYLGIILIGSLIGIGAIIALVISFPNGATIKIGLIGMVLFGGIFWAVLRGLWVKLEPPKGQLLTRAQAPKLFAMLDELREALDCKPFHRVLLIGEHNAAVVQIPRLGVFGWHRNHLLIGLPLLQSLAPEEFKAVMAHEFAHSSRGHGRFGNWLYRMRRSWDRIFEQMARQRSAGAALLLKFINWFWPIFNAHAFVLARANEYEADACSVRLAGADAASGALLRLPVYGNFLTEKFWPDIYLRANQEKEPPGDVWLTLERSFKIGPSTEESARWLRQAFLLETNNGDTHPCLKDRLRAIGRLPEGVEQGHFPSIPPPAPAKSAAEYYLEAHAQVAAQQLSEEWRKAIRAQWTARHEQAIKLASELAELEKPSDKAPDVEELWTKARKLLELQGDAAALPAVMQVLSLDSKHAAANFIFGRHHLEKDDPRGIDYIETALAEDPALTRDGCGLLYGHFSRTGQRDKLRPLEERVDRFQEEATLAQRERAQVTATDTFLAHDLKPDQIAALKKVFEVEPEIGSVAVARKRVNYFPKTPCYVIGLRISVAWWKPRSTGASQQLVNRVVRQIKLPGYFLVFVNEQNLKNLAKKVFAVPSAVIFERVNET